MLRLAIIIVIIVSVSGGIYSLALLLRLRKVYKIDYLNSFLYYKILHFVFGIYGIIGSIAIREILLKYDIKIAEIESIAIIIPFFGVPFIIAAWYILIKTGNELVSRKVRQSVAIVFFVLTTVSFLIYGLILRRLPEESNISGPDLSQLIRIVFYGIDIIVKVYILVLLFSSAIRSRNEKKNRFYARFGLVLAGFAILGGAALHFTYLTVYAGLYFLLIYFGSDLVLIVLLKSYLKMNESEFSGLTNNLESLYQKYGISKRERQIIVEICNGKTNQEIADELYISLQTVKDHTYNIFRKVNVRNRVQLTQVFAKTTSFSGIE